MIDFGSLPGLILTKIFNFLSLDDILNLRLTCSNILRSTNCEEVFKRVKVQVSKSTQRDYKILMNVLHKFGSYVELDIACSFNSDIMSILPSMTNVQDISADIRCFRDDAAYVRKSESCILICTQKVLTSAILNSFQT